MKLSRTEANVIFLALGFLDNTKIAPRLELQAIEKRLGDWCAQNELEDEDTDELEALRAEGAQYE